MNNDPMQHDHPTSSDAAPAADAPVADEAADMANDAVADELPAQFAAVPPAAPSEAKPTASAAKRSRQSPLGSFFSFVGELLKIVAVVLLLRAYVVQASSVDGRSMEPTLHHGDYLIVERMTPSFEHMPELLRKVVPDALIPALERGDVVVLSSPENGNNELVKRLIALPKDRIFFYEGRIYVNGKAIPEPYIRKQVHETPDGHDTFHYDQVDISGLNYSYRPSRSEFEAAFEANTVDKLGVEVPEGCVFVMGDNRNSGASNDSRAWARRELGSNSPGFGVDNADHMWATLRQINGRVIARVYPWPWQDEERPLLIK